MLAALGLDPTLDLLNLDLFAHGSNPTALKAKKLATMIANLVAATEGAAGGATSEALLVNALAALVTDTATGATIDFTSAATLNPLFAEAIPSVGGKRECGKRGDRRGRHRGGDPIAEISEVIVIKEAPAPDQRHCIILPLQRGSHPQRTVRIAPKSSQILDGPPRGT